MGSRVYIGKLPVDTRESDIERFFEGFGRINEILLRGSYGFVEFEDYRDAEDAIYERHGAKLLGQKVVVEATRKPPRSGGPRFRPGPPVRTNHRLIVKNLSTRVDWRQLKDYMRKAGQITFADAHRDRQNEGIVEFETRHDMKRGLKMFDDTELNGRYIRLVEERGRSRSRSSSRSRSRSWSRSRSRSRGRKSRSIVRSAKRSRSRSMESSRSRSRSITPVGSRSRSRSPSRSHRSKRTRSHSNYSTRSHRSKRSRSYSKYSARSERSGGRSSRRARYS
ncbi:serine-arginine protein 55-like [Aedes albopictus]|uniref:RRM domain-containing protein n=1 Tax=Aedes albopictus TaxID=7160 RepID=A0ABM2A0H9_AEDAL